MNKRDIVGRRVVDVRNERVASDPEYYGPRIVCTQIYLDDGSYITADCYESSDQPITTLQRVKGAAT